jgi:hypothetical protein
MQRSSARRFWRVANPVVRPLAGRAPWWVLLETTGRTSGLKRQVPLARGPLDGDTAWLIVVHGMHSDLGRNIATTPQVRLRLRGRWRTGVAEMMPVDETLLSKFNAYARGGLAIGSDPMMVRISLDPA